MPASTAPALDVANRAVVPWTWARALRDHGPKNRDLILTMLVLQTYMDSDGFAFPGWRAWAAAARMAVNTLREHADEAKATGWLSVEAAPATRRGHTGVVNRFRCSVPGHVPLSEKDEKLRAVLVTKVGEIGAPSVSPHGLTHSKTEVCQRDQGGVSKNRPSVSKKRGRCVTEIAQALDPRRNGSGSSEVLEVLEGAGRLKAREIEKDIQNAINRNPGFNDDQVANYAGVSAADVRRIRGSPQAQERQEPKSREGTA